MASTILFLSSPEHSRGKQQIKEAAIVRSDSQDAEPFHRNDLGLDVGPSLGESALAEGAAVQ